MRFSGVNIVLRFYIEACSPFRTCFAELALTSSPNLPKNHCGDISGAVQAYLSRDMASLAPCLFEVFFGKCDANIPFVVSATEWAAQAAWPTLKKVDECFESDFQAGNFFFQFLWSHVSSWIRLWGRKWTSDLSHTDTGLRS